MSKPHYHCPVNGYDCPYWKDGICELENPYKDCDDFASMWDEDDDFVCDCERGEN